MENTAKESQLIELTAKVEGWVSTDFLEATRGNKKYSLGRDKLYQGTCIDRDTTKLREDGVAFGGQGGKFRAAVILCDISFLTNHKEVTQAVLQDFKIPVSRRTKDTIFGFGSDRERQALAIMFEFDRNGDFTLVTSGDKRHPLTNIAKVIFKPDRILTYDNLNDVITSDRDSETRRFISAFNRLAENNFTFRWGGDNPAVDVVNKFMSVCSHLAASMCKQNGLPLIYTIDSDKPDGLPRYSITPKLSNYHGDKLMAQVSKPLNNIVAYVNHVLLYDHISNRKPSISTEELRDFVTRLNSEIDKLNGNKWSYKGLISGGQKSNAIENAPYEFSILDGQLRKSVVFIMANQSEYQSLPREQLTFDQVYENLDNPDVLKPDVLRKAFYPVIFYPSKKEPEVIKAKRFAKITLQESPLLALDMFNSIDTDVNRLINAKSIKSRYYLDKDGELKEDYSLNIKTNRGAYVDLGDSYFASKQAAAVALFSGVIQKSYNRPQQMPKTNIVLKGLNKEGEAELDYVGAENGKANQFFVSSETVKKYETLADDIKQSVGKSSKERLLVLLKKYGWSLEEEIFLGVKKGYSSKAKITLRGDGFGEQGIKVKLVKDDSFTEQELENSAFNSMLNKLRAYCNIITELKSPSLAENEALGRWLERVKNYSEGSKASSPQK